MSGLASRKYHPLASYYDSTGNPPAEWLTDDRVPLILRHEPKKVFHYGASLDMTGRMVGGLLMTIHQLSAADRTTD